MEPLIENISDTAKWVAVFRADESERPDAVFHDPFARRLAGEKGQQIADTIQFSKKNSWSFVARTYLFDFFIQQHVEQNYDMVINLAAGLDARPYRMNLPSTLQWVEIDLPGILRYKEQILKDEKPVCQLQRVEMDLADRDARRSLFLQLNKKAEKILVVCEGLILYLSDEEAGLLAQDLSAQPAFNRWILDLMSPGLFTIAQKEMGAHLKEANAPFRFAPQEGEDFFLKHGWKSIESRSKLKTAAELNRLNEEMMNFAAFPEPEGPKGEFPWTGVCLFENFNSK